MHILLVKNTLDQLPTDHIRSLLLIHEIPYISSSVSFINCRSTKIAYICSGSTWRKTKFGDIIILLSLLFINSFHNFSV